MTNLPIINNPDIALGIGALLGVGSAILVILIFLSYFLFSLMIVAVAMIFVKADRPSWASIIPFYNSYLLFEISMGKGWLGLICSFLPLIVFVSYQISIFLYLVCFVLVIFLSIKLANCFGKGIWFALGLMFLPFIFYPILAFSDDKYETKI